MQNSVLAEASALQELRLVILAADSGALIDVRCCKTFGRVIAYGQQDLRQQGFIRTAGATDIGDALGCIERPRTLDDRRDLLAAVHGKAMMHQRRRRV